MISSFGASSFVLDKRFEGYYIV